MKPLPLGGNQMHVIKATNRPDARTMLISFLNQQEPELASFLQTLWHNQGRAITYKELREAILNGSISPAWLQQWQQDYAQFVSRHLRPLWLVAMQNAAKRLQAQYPGWRFDAMADGVQRWTANRGAAFVTNSTNAQLQGLQAVIHHAANSGMNVDVLARAIRPMVGLTYQQSIANANYMQTLITNGMSKKKAVDKAIRYAARQHRYRGYNIARTELAFAYNQGTLEWARQAQEAGYLGKAVKIWRSARDERTCETCMRLHGMEIPLNEPFPFSTRLSGLDVRLAPPAHPSCRCALDIEEVEPPQLREDARYDIIEEIPQDMRGYMRSDGSFDLERAKQDYTAFLQTVPEKNRAMLVQSLEAVTFTQMALPDTAFGYLGKEDAICYDLSKEEFADYNFNVVLTHELAHRIDKYFVRSPEIKTFSDAIRDARAVLDADPEMFIAFAENDSHGFLSDVLSAICEDDYRFLTYHEKAYWLHSGNKEKELFANLFALESFRDEKTLSFLKKCFPRMLSVYESFLI